MSTHLQKPGSDVNAWALVHNDYHKTSLGGYEYIDIQLNANNPPTIKQYSRFSVYKTDNSYTISNAVATGNNNYPKNTTPTYNLSQAIFEDGADVTFTWAGSVRGETIATQSDGTWYIYCKNCLDTDATTKGQGVYNVSKTETPTFSIQKGGWYSANGYRVLGQFTSATNVVSALYVYRGNSPIERGIYNSKGVYSDATSIFIYPYEIEVAGKVYFSTATTTIRAWSGLAASATWYAAVMKETDGVISIVALGSGWDTYAISGNQLNLLSIYDPGYNYCRAARSAVFYRILSVFLSDATPDAMTYVFTIKNLPPSTIRCNTAVATTMTNNTAVIVPYDTILFDLNSDITTGAAWKFTAKKAIQLKFITRIILDSSAGWGAGELSFFYSYINNVQSDIFQRNMMQAAINPFYMEHTGTGFINLNTGDFFDIRCQQISGGNINLLNSAAYNYIEIKEA